jgi:hypothetical protein
MIVAVLLLGTMTWLTISGERDDKAWKALVSTLGVDDWGKSDDPKKPDQDDQEAPEEG